VVVLHPFAHFVSVAESRCCRHCDFVTLSAAKVSLFRKALPAGTQILHFVQNDKNRDLAAVLTLEPPRLSPALYRNEGPTTRHLHDNEKRFVVLLRTLMGFPAFSRVLPQFAAERSMAPRNHLRHFYNEEEGGAIGDSPRDLPMRIVFSRFVTRHSETVQRMQHTATCVQRWPMEFS
jgi:hypothetical protein